MCILQGITSFRTDHLQRIGEYSIEIIILHTQKWVDSCRGIWGGGVIF